MFAISCFLAASVKKLFQRESDQQVHLYSRDRKFCDEASKVF